MMKIYYMKSLVAFILMAMVMETAGCVHNKDANKTNGRKTQFEALLEDFTNLDNTLQRVEKRHQEVVLPIKKIYEDFSKLPESEQLIQAKEFAARVEQLVLLLPEDNHTIRLESRGVVYARRYGSAVKEVIMNGGLRQTKNDRLNEREVLNSWLGYCNAYNRHHNKQITAELTENAISKLKIGYTYNDVANTLQLPGEKIAVYLSANSKDNARQEINIWVEDNSYLLVKFQNDRSTDIVPGLAKKIERGDIKINNPMAKLNAKNEIVKFENVVVAPAREAYDSFHREFGAFCKQNKDGDACNKKRVELATKYYKIIKTIKDEAGKTDADVSKITVAKNYGFMLKRQMEAYLEANTKILDANQEICNKAWLDNNLFYRKTFDTSLEYEHFKSVALMKDETYALVARETSWLQNGHNYFHFASAYKMPGKLLSSEIINVNNKNIHQEIYLWVLNNDYCLVTFHNGGAVNIKQMGIW